MNIAALLKQLDTNMNKNVLKTIDLTSNCDASFPTSVLQGSSRQGDDGSRPHGDFYAA